MKKNPIIPIVCLALIAAAVVLALVVGVKFAGDFAGGTSVTVTLDREATREDLNKASASVGNVSSARILDGKRLFVKTSGSADRAALAQKVAADLGVEASAVSVAETDRIVTRSAFSAALVSLVIAGAVVVVWFAIRFGILPALDTIFGLAVVAAVWLIPYIFFPFDYTALFIFAVGAAVYSLILSLVFDKRVKKNTEINASRAFGAAAFITVAGVVICAALGIFSGIWSTAIPLAVTLVGACFAALYGAPACLAVVRK